MGLLIDEVDALIPTRPIVQGADVPPKVRLRRIYKGSRGRPGPRHHSNVIGRLTHPREEGV